MGMVIKRRMSRKIKVGNVEIGGDAPISIQSMAKTDTRDFKRTKIEIKKLEKAGCEIVRVAVLDLEAAHAIKEIKKGINIPLVADIHFHHKLALESIRMGADCIRLNPGNIKKREELKEIIQLAKVRKVPIRIGVNSGSIGEVKPACSVYGGSGRGGMPELMAKRALEYIRVFEEMDFYELKVSLKASNVIHMIDAYKLLAEQCDYPLHLGVTATGLPDSGVVKSAIGIGVLLLEGIGDTIRVSLAGDPKHEVNAGEEILSALGLREFGPEIIACPTCGRSDIDVVRIAEEVKKKLNSLKTPPRIKVAIMGCEVNGPGEAKDADIGIAGGRGVGMLFKRGERLRKVKEGNLVEELVKEICGGLKV